MWIVAPAAAQDAAELHNAQPFDSWLKDFKKEAAAQGISSRTLDVLDNVNFLPDVIELDRKQPESTITFAQYLNRVVTPKRIVEGRELYADNRALLEEVGNKYSVPPKFIVALWGVESSFGSHTGSYSVVDSLATLAYDGRRSEFFRDELLKTLQILDNGDIEVFDMTGSWAGAMGQCQFMPSSYLRFAQDHDGDGKRDIWYTQADIFASIANYLHESGWNDSEGWGFPVTLPVDFDVSLADIKQTKDMGEWAKLGVRTADGEALPDNGEVSLILVGEGDAAEPYIIYSNYKVLLKWNRSRYFATAVGTLADAVEQ